MTAFICKFLCKLIAKPKGINMATIIKRGHCINSAPKISGKSFLPKIGNCQKIIVKANSLFMD